MAEEWWDDFEAGELYEVGVNSFGRPCMWLPLKPVRRKQNELSVESAFRESSGDLKNLKQEDTNAFRALAQNSTSSFQDAFFDKKFNVPDTKKRSLGPRNAKSTLLMRMMWHQLSQSLVVLQPVPTTLPTTRGWRCILRV